MKSYIYRFDTRLKSVSEYGFPINKYGATLDGEEMIMELWCHVHQPKGIVEYYQVAGVRRMFHPLTQKANSIYVFDNENDYDSFSEWVQSIYNLFGEGTCMPTVPNEDTYDGMTVVAFRSPADHPNMAFNELCGLEEQLVMSLAKCIEGGKGKIFFFNVNGQFRLVFTDPSTAMIFRCNY